MLATAANSCVMMSNVFLFTRSATTPPIGATTSIGRVMATAMKPNEAAEWVKS
jgi:hypothetical protein